MTEEQPRRQRQRAGFFDGRRRRRSPKALKKTFVFCLFGDVNVRERENNAE